MMTIGRNRAARMSALLLAAAFMLSPLAALAQTHITAPRNKYKTSDDVQLGQQYAQQVYQQMPILRDSYVREYANSVGQRLAASIPPEYQHPEFRYTFDVVDARDINAFSLPGGPMFLNRGMIEAADTEGEMAGVMAHEMSHVMLRHGTAQQTKATPYEIGAVAGQILGAIVGGTAGSIVEVSLPRLFFKQHEIIGSTMGSYGEFAEVTRMVEQGLPVVIDEAVEGLQRFPEALERMGQGAQLGKLVVSH